MKIILFLLVFLASPRVHGDPAARMFECLREGAQLRQVIEAKNNDFDREAARRAAENETLRPGPRKEAGRTVDRVYDQRFPRDQDARSEGERATRECLKK